MQTEPFDVVVVGSGAAGGTLASHLARAGVRVAIVEGGPRVNTRTDFNTHAMPFDFPTRQIPTMRPGKAGFDSERSRGVGGKTMLWNAVALRLSQRDFKGRTYEGAGEDWPIDYKDVAPYYDAIEREVGVCGNLDGLEDLPDGVFLPPVPMKCSDQIMQRAARSLGASLVHVRKATLTVPTATRLACHFCGNCMAGCDVVAKYNSADVHIAPAEKSGLVTVFPDCIAREVLVSNANRATGVRYLHRVHQREGEVRGRSVVVACACVQSIALLLMSTSSRYPTGLANSSGQLGRHFIPHFTGGIECVLEGLRGARPVNEEGFLDHAYLPSFMHDRKRPYARLPCVRAVHAVRRDAAERAVLRGPRSLAGRQVRAAAGAPPRAVGRERGGAVQRHGALEPGDAGEGRGGDPDRARGAGAQPRAGRVPDGARSADVGRERRLPHPRPAEPLRRRRERVPVGVGEEPDAHHHGARGARRRPHRGTDETR
jgi:hypothetical protein